MLIETRQIQKSFVRGEESVEALKGISFTVQAGEFVSIMGPSGSGKSTLLHLLGGLDQPTGGEILLEGRRLSELNDRDLSAFRRRRLGFIFQFFNLLPTLSALENVALPRLLDGEPIQKVAPKARALLERMGLGHRLDHRPDHLSGGEMQRVAIARALVTDPAVILADEPTGNLDSKTGEGVLKLLRDLVLENKQTLLMVTHDLHAASYGTRLLRLRDGLLESDSRLTAPPTERT